MSSFSPTPMNLIGTPVTSLIDRAAPPRASPSSLVRMHAVEFERIVERLGAVDGVLAGHRVDDEIDLVRPDLAVDLPQLVHQLLVDVQPAGGVEDDGVAELFCLACATALLQTSTGVRRFRIDRDADLLAEHLELLDGGGSLQVGGDEQRLAAPLAQRRAPACRRWSFCRRPAGRTA